MSASMLAIISISPRVIRESDKVDKLFKWYGDHRAAWARVCEAIEIARASGN